MLTFGSVSLSLLFLGDKVPLQGRCEDVPDILVVDGEDAHIGAVLGFEGLLCSVPLGLELQI